MKGLPVRRSWFRFALADVTVYRVFHNWRAFLGVGVDSGSLQGT